MGPRTSPVHDDIRRAFTLPADAYTDEALHRRAVEQIFARSWQLAGDTDQVRVSGQVLPLTLLEGCLDEPILLTRDDGDRLHALSNVCTHRAALVAECPGHESVLRCRYHGRRFALDGRFLSMPEFDGAVDFPSPRDDLPRIPMGTWGKLVFCALDPAFPLDALLAPVRERLSWLPLDDFKHDPSRSRDYLVRANWAAYCDNYLEGFHIPFVHAALADVLDYGSYRTETFEYASLQIGVARGGEDAFDLPAGSPDHGERIGAYYFWLFPNTMLNFYPWGLSINVVKPLAVDLTRVSFVTWVLDASRIDLGAGAALDRVEREDEAVVESVQRGLRSRLYRAGRFSPARETGVHHFHRLVARFLELDGAGR